MHAMHRQVFLLASAQALFQTVSVLVMTIGGLAGAQIAPTPEWATAPIASMFLGTAIATVPASMWMARVGRRVGFVTGALLGTLGGLLAAAGVVFASLPLLCLGTLFVGTYQAFAQFYRFAASEVSDNAFRSRAISLVLAGGVVAALAGPALGRLGGDLMQPAYVASFLILSVVSLIAAGVLLGVKVPRQVDTAEDKASARGLGQIVRQPTYLVALFGAVTGYGVMILAMTATPLAMAHHHHGLAETATVIQLHVLGMFLPSFFTGSLIARFGVLRVMFTGIVLLAGHVLISLSGTEFYSFAGALILLGVGWNFLYVGGTNLLTRAYSTAEKGKAQATNDLTIFLVGLAASLSAGVLQNTVGWQTLNMLLLPWLAIAAAAIVWLGRRREGVLETRAL
ncbi:MFS transporter [Devosia nitrariae]|uniref:MFS transporter n=1 Tax=Devosia nitrariae TaxID=2071872 RepID=A0ABQ5W9F6_9HYPH|nr:MFS transporter [Devosia nitrariae]GLQ56735.1 MFS transporter [Devosia nitrariae]